VEVFLPPLPMLLLIQFHMTPLMSRPLILVEPWITGTLVTKMFRRPLMLLKQILMPLLKPPQRAQWKMILDLIRLMPTNPRN
jgi:hypothetical protein